MTAGLKTCSVCDTDLNGQKRVKDETGSYFCPTCWEARVEMLQSAPKTPVRPTTTAAAPVSRLKPAAPSATVVKSIVVPAAPPEGVMGKKLGFLAAGVGAVGFFDLLPMYQASNHVPSLTVSFKGIGLGWIALCVAMVAMLPENIGITWKRPPGQTASPAEQVRIKVLFGIAAVVGVGMAVLTWTYIKNQGYSIGF